MFDRDTITVAKALVIGSVVLGHILEALILNGNENKFIEGFYNSIYLFHMPFYFILSGWLFKGSQPKANYLIKKSKHLLVPYLAWLIIFNLKAIAGFGANLLQGHLDGDKSLFYRQHFLSQLYGGMEVHGIQMILWFPTCLFFTQQLANTILRKYEKQTIIVISIGIMACTLGYINQLFFPEFYLPLAINVVMGALPLFLLGYYIKKYPPSRSLFWGLLVFFLVACVFIFAFNYPLTYQMRKAKYGVPLISTFAALGGFFIVMLLSKQIARSKYLFSFLQPLGKSSMTIMYLHALILVQLRALNIYDGYMLLILGILIPTIIHLAFVRVNILSKLFLGEDRIQSAI